MERDQLTSGNTLFTLLHRNPDGQSVVSVVSRYRKEIENAVYAGLGLLALYFLIMRWASGSWEATIDQFFELWTWMSILILGFAVQVGLYTRLRRLQKEKMHMAVTGTSAATSGAAMIACCAHHAVDVLPILGLSGAAVFLAEYQVKFLILGALMNVLGIAYIFYQLNRVAGTSISRDLAGLSSKGFLNTNLFKKNSFWSNTTAVIATLLLIVGSVYAGQKAQQNNQVITTNENESLVPSPLPTGPVEIPIKNQPYLGEKKADVEVVAFMDFQCQYSKQFAETIVPPMKERYIDQGKVRFVVKDFPLQNHVNAWPASYAANCALDLGGDEKYFEYFNLLYENQDDWDIENTAYDFFESYAVDIGLDTDKFQKCYAAEDSKDDIEQDVADGQAVGVNGTPVFFVNGKSFVGVPPTFEDMEKILEEELARYATSLQIF